MRDSDPGVRIVFVHGHDSDLNSIFTVQTTGCNFQYVSNFDVPSDPTFSFRCFFVSWQSVLTTSYCIELWEFCQCPSSWRTVRFQQHSEIPHPYKICSICLVVKTFQFVSPYLCNRRSLWAWLSQSKGNFQSWSRLARLKNSTALPQRVSPFYHEKDSFSSHFLRLLRRDWAD